MMHSMYRMSSVFGVSPGVHLYSRVFFDGFPVVERARAIPGRIMLGSLCIEMYDIENELEVLG